MYVVLWEYIVKAGQEAEFEKIYGSSGGWVRLFKKAHGYLGTELLRDVAVPRRYITIDRWISPAAYAAFQKKHRVAYDAIDAHCEYLTENEALIGLGNLSFST